MPDPLSVVIYNPVAGRGRARKQIEAAQSRMDQPVRLRSTEHAGHGAILAQEAIQDGARHIIAAGGDGTVHEVASGIINSGVPDAKLGIWPLGSMNDLAFSLGLLDWWRDPSRPLSSMRIDIGQAQTAQKTMWFFDAAGVGFNGMVTIESRKTKWLKGVPLYAWGLIKAMAKHFAKPRMTIEIDGKIWDEPTLAFSLCNGQREGGFPLGLNASLDDGQFHVVHVGGVKRWELIYYLPNLITGHLPKNHPLLRQATTTRAHVRSEQPLCCHLDGEFLCRPDDGIKELQFDLHPQRLFVDCFPSGLYGGRKTS